MRYLLLLLIVSHTVQAARPEFDLYIKNKMFEPARLVIPANTKVRIMVHNQDDSPEEFESYELNREKVIPGKSKSAIFVGPLPPGQYPFFGEFSLETAQGILVVE
jgi:hypothetical protein